MAKLGERKSGGGGRKWKRGRRKVRER